jgi:hypothetical protein
MSSSRRCSESIRALEQVEGVGTLSSPIKDMEDVSAGALPDLMAFLPLWVKRLQRFRPSKDEWETKHERWLREAVFRADGVGGLERIARQTKRPQACLAGYEALADQGDWTAALKACDAAARMVRKPHWRGELLDGAALAAQELGRSDLSKRLDAAWRAAPTMPRLLRCRAVDGDEHERIRPTAARSLARCSKTATRQIGLLRVLVGDVTGAAAVLAKSPGLGWSNPDHAGHTLFPLLAMLLSNGTIGGASVTELEATGRDPLGSFAVPDEEHKPRLRTPSIVVLIQRVRPSIALTDPDRDALIDAMRIAANSTGGARRSERSWRERVKAWVCSWRPELYVA